MARKLFCYKFQLYFWQNFVGIKDSIGIHSFLEVPHDINSCAALGVFDELPFFESNSMLGTDASFVLRSPFVNIRLNQVQHFMRKLLGCYIEVDVSITLGIIKVSMELKFSIFGLT
jgi:hypothetical protein